MSSRPVAGRSQVLQNMEGLGAAIILLERPGLVLPGSFFEGGIGKGRLISRDFYMHRLGHNLIGGLSCSLRSRHSEGWVAVKLESRFP